MSPAWLMLLTFLAVALGVLGLYSLLSDLVLRDRACIKRRVDEEFRWRQREQIRRSALFKNLGPLAPELPAEDEEVTPTLRERFEALVEQSGLNLTPRRLLTMMVGGGLSLGLLGFLLRDSVLVGALLGVGGAIGPWLYVLRQRLLRLGKLLNQLPDAFELMSRIVRAGQTMPQAMQAVADEFEPPIAAEFAYCYEQQNLGLAPETSLRDLARRTGLLEIKILVLSLLVQQQTGGNLAQLLDNLAGVVRERIRIQGRIRALTAEGRFQALVLLALPPFVFVAMLVLYRDFAKVLLDHPNLLIGMGIAMGIGAWWIRRIVNFDF